MLLLTVLFNAGNYKAARILSFLPAFICSFLMPSSSCSAQDSLSGHNVLQHYLNTIGESALVYNGTEYTNAYPGTSGTPFFGSGNFQNGTIGYNGIIYERISMAFDMVGNELVVKENQGLSLILDRSKVDSFMLDGHLFVHIVQDSLYNDQPPEGFYEVLVQGPLTVLARRIKIVQHGATAEEPMHFGTYTTYFIRKNNRFYPVSSKSSLLNLFNDQRQKMNAFWKQNKWNSKKDFEEAIVKMVRFYNQSNV